MKTSGVLPSLFSISRIASIAYHELQTSKVDTQNRMAAEHIIQSNLKQLFEIAKRIYPRKNKDEPQLRRPTSQANKRAWCGVYFQEIII